MSEEILEILDEEGEVRPGAGVPPLSDGDLLCLFRAMLFNRLVDERMTKLQRQGRIGFYVGSMGEEAAINGSAFALEPQDWVVPCYREVGAAFVRGYSLDDFLAQLYGNSRDPIKGRQMPCHWASPSLHLASVSSPVGTQIPHAVGLAMAARAQRRPEVALTYFGDGATSHGDFHVSCNFAGVFKAPVIFFCRNNQYAISVPLEQQTASVSIAIKACAYGIDGIRVDGNDVLAVHAATREAADRARRGDGPTLIEALTYRQGAHTTSDDPRAYRHDSEVEEWIRKDPVARFRLFLEKKGILGPGEEAEMAAEIRGQIQTALKKTESLGPPSKDSMFEDVFDTVPWHLEEQRSSLYEEGEA